MFKLLPLWFIAEIAAFWFGVQHLGFWDTMMYWWAPSFLGFIVTSSFSKSALATMQASAMSGQLSDKKIMHAAAIFFGGVLMWLPFIVTRLMGVLFVLPGTRHLLIWKLKAKVAEKLAQGAKTGFQFYRFDTQNGFQGGGFQAGGFKTQRSERDVTPSTDVLDVKPIEVTHSSSSDPKSSN